MTLRDLLSETASDTVSIFKNPDITDFKPVIADARPKTKSCNLLFSLINQA